MKFTEHFDLRQMTDTSTALDNTPNEEQICRLRVLCEKVLQPLRDWYKKPIIVTSGYRSHRVNKKVGGADSSQHTKGEAADITGGSKTVNKLLYEWIRDNLEYDQLINEHNYQWVHVSFTTRRPNRKQQLVIK